MSGPTIKEVSNEIMKKLYGSSLASLPPAHIAARLILHYISGNYQQCDNWYMNISQIDERSGEGKVIIFASHTGFLAHTGRSLLVAKALRDLGATVLFLANNHSEEDKQREYTDLIIQEGFKTYETSLQAGARLIMNKARAEATWRFYDESMIRDEVQSQCRALQSIRRDFTIKPNAIVSDLSPVMSITAEIENIPLISILNFTWTHNVNIRHTPPEMHRITRTLFALGMGNITEYVSFKLGTTTLLLRMLLVFWVMPYNRIRKDLGLKKKSSFYDQMSGDLILMPDFAGFRSMKMTKTALPIGPLIWEPKREVILTHVNEKEVDAFQKFLNSNPEMPLIYLTMGSTGTLSLFRTVIAALKDKPYRLAITTGGQFDISALGELPPNVFAIPLFPGKQILQKASVTINHGGSGSVYQAITAQVPQIMIPTHPDQQWNADIVQAEGGGIRMRCRSLTEQKISDAVKALLVKR